LVVGQVNVFEKQLGGSSPHDVHYKHL